VSDLAAIVADIAAEMALEAERGTVANYIPELADVDPGQFGLCVTLPDGQVFAAGDADVPFSIQSISKVFSLALALGRVGDGLWSRVGREPSGSRFNSIVQLEQEQGRPRNPFINAGALVTTDALLAGREPKAALAEILAFLRDAADDDEISVNEAVAASEAATGHTNRALAEFMAGFGNLRCPVDQVTGTYFHHCAIEMTCRQLSRVGLCFAGVDTRRASSPSAWAFRAKAAWAAGSWPWCPGAPPSPHGRRG